MRTKTHIALILILTFLITASGCSTASVAKTTDSTILESTAAIDTTKEPTETAAATTTVKPTQKATSAPTPTVKETTAATTTKASETTAPAATTKETAKPTPKPTKTTTAATAAPVETAAPPVETAAPVATTAAPATDYTAVCADIRSKLIANLEANGQWDPSGVTDGCGGQKWWGIGWYDDGDMTTQDFADEYYNGKFAGASYKACGIDCYVADGKIYLDFQGYYVT